MIENDLTNLGEEIVPYLVYRICDEQMECAVWTLDEGHQALALFLSEQSAETYVKTAGLSPDWKIYCPPVVDLVAILRQSISADILVAALDPDDTQAKRLFDLREVVKATDKT